MNLIKIILFIFLSTLTLTSNAKNFEFQGQWCGKWDDIYKTCFTIVKNEKQWEAEYKWEENLGAGFSKKNLRGKQVNDNTLDFEGKIIILNLNEPNTATAVGLFQTHSRSANLVKILND